MLPVFTYITQFLSDSQTRNLLPASKWLYLELLLHSFYLGHYSSLQTLFADIHIPKYFQIVSRNLLQIMVMFSNIQKIYFY
jgi:hypothetical protein